MLNLVDLERYIQLFDYKICNYEVVFFIFFFDKIIIILKNCQVWRYLLIFVCVVERD